jgi:hypothetical protein
LRGAIFSWIMILLPIVLLHLLAAGIGIVEAARPTNQGSSSDPPTLSLTPNPANPGSFVKLSGEGFDQREANCSISSPSPNLFQATPQCFTGHAGNITGIFQVNTLASKGEYTVVVDVYFYICYYSSVPPNCFLHEQYANASIAIEPPPAVTTTITTPTTQTSTKTLTTTIRTASTVTTTIRTEITVPQFIMTVLATATVTVVASYIYVIHTIATIRTTLRMTKRQPGFAFDVEVKSGVNLEESPD